MTEQEHEGEDKGLSPEDLFDKNKFITLLVKGEEFKSASREHTDLVESLLDPAISRPVLEELYKLVKQEGLGHLLIETSEKEEDPIRKAKLLAACWEIGFDASPYLFLLTKLVYHNDFQVAFEALTVLETIELFSDKVIARDTLQWAEVQKPVHVELAKQAILHLNNLL